MWSTVEIDRWLPVRGSPQRTREAGRGPPDLTAEWMLPVVISDSRCVVKLLGYTEVYTQILTAQHPYTLTTAQRPNVQALYAPALFGRVHSAARPR